MTSALEDLIRQLNPFWRGGKKEAFTSPDFNVSEDQANEIIPLPMASFSITLGQTYHEKGFLMCQ